MPSRFFGLSKPTQVNNTSTLPVSQAQKTRQPVPAPSALHYEVQSMADHQPRKFSDPGHNQSSTTSAATSRSTTAENTYTPSKPYNDPVSIKEAALKAKDLVPTSDVAEWAHQMHIKQNKSYWWCHGCYPVEVFEPQIVTKAVEKAVTGYRRRAAEPSHCYG